MLIGGDWHIPKGGGDLESFLWPIYRYASHTLRSGELPLWNPYLYSGAPYAADNQSGLYYPLHLLLAVFPDIPYRFLEWLVVIHFFLAGAGMYMVARHHWPRTSMHPPLVSALAFQFSSVFVTHIGNLNIVATAAYLPWCWLLLHRMKENRHLSSAASLALVLSLAVLVGHAQMTFAIVLVMTLAASWILISQPAKIQWVTLSLLTGVLTLGLCSIFLLPTLELTQFSLRSNPTYEHSTQYSLPPIGLAGMFSPLLFGRGPEYFWAPWDRVELGFAGITTLMLSVFGLRQNAIRGFLMAVLVAGVLIALGPITPIHSLLYDYLPGFAKLRVPARFILLTNFSLALLACNGLHHWQKNIIPKKQFSNAVLLLVSITILALLIGWNQASQQQPTLAPKTLPLALTVALMTLAAALILGPHWVSLILAVELIGLGAWVEIDRADPDKGYSEGAAVAFLRSQPKPFRIDVATNNWQPNAPTVFNLEAINGLHNPLTIAHYHTYYWSVGYRGSPQYNFLNAKYLITDKGKPAADSTFVPVFDADPDVDIYLNTNAQPRLRLVSRTIIAQNNADALKAVHHPDFNPANQVVLPAHAVSLDHSLGQNTIRYTNYAPHSQSIEVHSASPAYLVFSEVWYPGWSATLNGVSTTLLKANYAFRAVYIPTGKHTVTLEFAPTSFPYAPAISISTLVAVLALLATSLYHQPRGSNAHHKD